MFLALLAVVVIVCIYMSIHFVLARQRGRLDMVDAVLGGAYIVAAVSSFFIGRGVLGWNMPVLITILVCIWAIRLGGHMWRRFRASRREDPRYKEFRKSWKQRLAVNAYLRLFIGRGLLVCVILLPVILVNLGGPVPAGRAAFIGFLVWIIGFMYEVVADAQLRQFQANKENKGKLMTEGLWFNSRHPNYFGEILQWWGIFLMALHAPHGWLGIVSPLTVMLMLCFVTGIPRVEQRFAERPGWSDYKKRTSVLIPLPKKIL
jgi:steroid 5-alpha reductase family enzyme